MKRNRGKYLPTDTNNKLQKEEIIWKEVRKKSAKKRKTVMKTIETLKKTIYELQKWQGNGETIKKIQN